MNPRKCSVCGQSIAGRGTAHCRACRGVCLRMRGLRDRNPGLPVAGHDARVERYAARAGRGEPLFTAADRALRVDPCE